MSDGDGNREQVMEDNETGYSNKKIQLINKWSNMKMDECYKKMMLTYLNQMDPATAIQQINQEIQKLNEKRSQHIKMQALKEERQQILGKLLQVLQDDNDLQQACQNLDKLRKINLKICEIVILFKQTLEKKNIGLKSLVVGYGQYLTQLSEQNYFIINSYLSQQIDFGKGYDPFFLNPYEKMQAEGISQHTPDPVSKLFKMNISYVYRLIKAKNQLVQILNSPINQVSNSFNQQKKQEQVSEKQHEQQKIKKSISLNIKKGRRLILPNKKFQTINHDNLDSITKGSSLRVHSEPKKSSKGKLIFEEDGGLQKQPQRKFRVREISQPERSFSLRNKSQNYQMAQDEDINIFRKKMLARRAKRKKSGFQSKNFADQQEQVEQIKIKKQSLQMKKKVIKSFEPEKQAMNMKNVHDAAQQQESSEQQIMQPMNLDETPKYEKLNIHGSKKTRQFFRKRNQRLKLEPLIRVKYNRAIKQENYQPEENKDGVQLPISIKRLEESTDNKKLKQIYYPLSPQIQEMNKQSSSGNSKDSEQELALKNREQIFGALKNQSVEQNKKKLSFLIRRNIKATNPSENSIKQFAETHPIIGDDMNEKKFRDLHIRRPKEEQLAFRMTQSRISNKFNNKNEEKTENKFGNQIEEEQPQKQKQKVSRLEITKYFQEKAERQKEKQKNLRQQQTEIPTYRYHNQTQSNYPSSVAPYRIATEAGIKVLGDCEQEDENKYKKKQVKLKPGQIKINDLFAFIQKQRINQFQRKQFQVGLWKQKIMLKHSYLTKFYHNSELAAFGISSPRCDGDYNILYWGTTCAENFTIFLFKKYLDYLEKFTNLNNIYIGNPQYQEVDFMKKGSMYVRKRKNFQKRTLSYFPFLSLQCSNICYQTNQKQNSIFYSQEIQQFNQTNCALSNFVGFCSPKNVNNIPQSSTFHENIQSIAEVNRLLQNLEIDNYATSQKIQIKQCKVFTLKEHLSMKCNYFYVQDGFFIPKGIQVHSKQKQKIMRLQLNKENYYLFFGKKMSNIQHFVSNCTLKSGPDLFFAFKMFSKQLYGRIRKNEFTDSGCYGNWDVNFLWQDQLKGTVIKDMPASEYLFGPESFYVALFKSQTFILAFEVKSSDFFF